MGGLKHFKMAMDPAILKLANTTSNRHKYFRWTPRTAKITFVYVAVIPVLLGVVAYKTDGKYDFRAKRRGDVPQEF